jgi:hypothetical protein
MAIPTNDEMLSKMIEELGAMNQGKLASGLASASHSHGLNTSVRPGQALNVASQKSLPDRWSEQYLFSMLASRLRWDDYNTAPFRRVVPCRVTDDKVVVFVVTKGEALLVEDDAHMYPSDALVTQLRLLAEATR